MTTDPIRVLFASDLHFGGPSHNQTEMADAFAKIIFPLIPQNNIFFINGDFYDTAVVFNNHGFDPIVDTIFGIFDLCELHQVKLRILQGTWSHDRDQIDRITNLHRNRRYTFDYRAVKTIDLEEIAFKDRSLRFLYVPDDLPFKSSDAVLDVIHSKLAEKGWDDIDYACMHGFFDFTYHKNASTDNVVVYREEQFGFVKKAIDVGHVHQNRSQGKVISNGSFDRGCHGDEDPKGLIQVIDYPKHYTAHFVENPHAAVYDTLIFDKTDTTQTMMDRIDAHVKSLVTNRIIHLRFLIENQDQKQAVKLWMKETYPDIVVAVKSHAETKDKPVIVPSNLLTTMEKRVAPTRKTIATFIRSYLPDDYPLTIQAIDTYLEPPAV